MKNKHILHIGFPRCGSTWVWQNLIQHPALEQPPYDKENKIMFGDDYSGYYEFYKSYAVSANFNPNLWFIDSTLIKHLGNYATHVSIMLRNPYNFVERYYDFVNRDQDPTAFVDDMIDMNYLNYQKICQRWSAILDSKTKFKIFYFDDIKHNSKEFLSNYFTFCDLDVILANDYNRIVNKSVYSENTTICFLDKHKEVINNYIDNFSNYTNTNLSHWKQ